MVAWPHYFIGDCRVLWVTDSIPSSCLEITFVLKSSWRQSMLCRLPWWIAKWSISCEEYGGRIWSIFHHIQEVYIHMTHRFERKIFLWRNCEVLSFFFSLELFRDVDEYSWLRNQYAFKNICSVIKKLER